MSYLFKKRLLLLTYIIPLFALCWVIAVSEQLSLEIRGFVYLMSVIGITFCLIKSLLTFGTMQQFKKGYNDGRYKQKKKLLSTDASYHLGFNHYVNQSFNNEKNRHNKNR